MQRPNAPQQLCSRRGAITRVARAAVAACLPWTGLPGCSSLPVKIGFLGGLTGPTADLGVAGRDSTLLAVEQLNQRGGLRGKPVELVAFDDRQQPKALPELAGHIRQAGLMGMVGPMTSSMAAVWIPLANEMGLTTVSPTVTGSDFTGKDDHFFRVCSTTREYAYISADYHMRTGHPTRFAVVRDDSNAAYTRSWVQHFVDRVTALGGQVAVPVVYASGQPSDALAGALAQALAHQPEVLVIVANARDTALLAQLLRKQGSALPLSAAEWAATDQVLSSGGRAVEKLVVAQYFDPSSAQAAYSAFVQAFKGRYGRSPGFAEVAAFDAATVMLHALAGQRADETLKQALLRIRQFDGLQQTVAFDAWGDAARPLFMTQVMNGQFTVVP